LERPPLWQALVASRIAATSRIATALLVAIPLLAGWAQGWEAPLIGLALAAGTLATASLEQGLHQRLASKKTPQRLAATLRVESSTTLTILAPATYILIAAATALTILHAAAGTAAATLALATASTARGYAGRVAITGLLHGAARTSVLATLLTGAAAILYGWGWGARLILALAIGYGVGLSLLLAALSRVGAFSPGLARGRPAVARPGVDALVSAARLGLAGGSLLAGLDGLLVLTGVLVGEAGGRLGAPEEPYGALAYVGVLAGPVVVAPLSGGLGEPAVTAVLCGSGLRGLGFRDVMGWVLAV